MAEARLKRKPERKTVTGLTLGEMNNFVLGSFNIGETYKRRNEGRAKHKEIREKLPKVQGSKEEEKPEKTPLQKLQEFQKQNEYWGQKAIESLYHKDQFTGRMEYRDYGHDAVVLKTFDVLKEYFGERQPPNEQQQPSKHPMLSIGCGCLGREITLMKLLKGVGIDIELFAFDKFPKVIEVAKENVKRHDIGSNINLFLGDYNYFALDKKKFDVIFASLSLGHSKMSEVMETMNNVGAALNPGGIAVIVLPSEGRGVYDFYRKEWVGKKLEEKKESGAVALVDSGVIFDFFEKEHIERLCKPFSAPDQYPVSLDRVDTDKKWFIVIRKV